MRLPIQRFGLALLLVAALPRTAFGGSDEDPRMAPRGAPPERSQPRAALPTGGPGIQPVYFTPQDNSTNATVLFLHNTNAVEVTVRLQGWNVDGTMLLDEPLVIPARSSIRVVTDSLVATAPPSWAGATVINFTDFVLTAAVLMPTGVKIDGYVEWNPGTGTVNPDAATARVPLRFSVGGDAP